MHALQNDIMDLILRRNLDVGNAMPTESELCAELGVGRNTVREALKVLQALGVVEIRHGFGTFVAATSFASLGSSLAFRGRLSLRHGGQEALELVDVRQALESGLVGSAIDATTEADIVILDELVTAMETRAQQGLAFLEEDQEFHRHLYTPLRNELLSNLLEVFWNVYRQIHEEVGVEQHGLIESAQQHREILDAVVHRDKILAAERINLHFTGIRTHLTALGG
ncbi:FadR family transcriptional regulator [Mycetocola zhadangensis]|uniref:FadR family transcriptional regulator n=2 Tax=Mycetocola zhadangensis TaxID=1164595 RepID=A0A3L7IX74_9MICO|nr:FadR family transcriptional regulator [Mycetocola zhadangensis]